MRKKKKCLRKPHQSVLKGCFLGFTLCRSVSAFVARLILSDFRFTAPLKATSTYVPSLEDILSFFFYLHYL